MTTVLDRRTGSGQSAPLYALGYSEAEFRRLELQGAFFRDLTQDVLQRAGIEAGMHVLDLGCGVGDVSLLAAEFVGPSGSVLGIDRSPEAVGVAKARAAAGGRHWVAFEAADVDAYTPKRPLDAIVGRLILGYLPDPAGAVRRLATGLRPNGVVAFQEIALPLIRSVPSGPLFEQCSRWIKDTFVAAGFEIDMGGKLFATFAAAGLPPPQMIAAGRVGGGADCPIYDYTAGILRSLVPMAERFGIATAADVDVDTVAERLRCETVAYNACIMLPPLVGAWTRTSGAGAQADT